MAGRHRRSQAIRGPTDVGTYILTCRRRRNGRRAAGLVVVLALATSACSQSEPVDPGQARRDRVRARLDASFSITQARCILDRLDVAGLRALDGKRPLAADSPELRQFSEAVRGCVNEPPTPAAPPRAPTTSG